MRAKAQVKAEPEVIGKRGSEVRRARSRHLVPNGLAATRSGGEGKPCAPWDRPVGVSVSPQERK